MSTGTADAETTLTPRMALSVGLPDWATLTLDAALGAGVIDADELDGLKTIQLLALASSVVRAALESFEADAAVRAAHNIERRRPAA